VEAGRGGGEKQRDEARQAQTARMKELKSTMSVVIYGSMGCGVPPTAACFQQLQTRFLSLPASVVMATSTDPDRTSADVLLTLVVLLFSLHTLSSDSSFCSASSFKLCDHTILLGHNTSAKGQIAYEGIYATGSNMYLYAVICGAGCIKRDIYALGCT
jgi:hypothetical protein